MGDTTPKPFHKDELPVLEKLAGIGLTVIQMAAYLGMSKATFYRRAEENPEILEAVARGRAMAIGQVATAAYNMAKNGKNFPATRWFLASQAGWKEASDPAPEDDNPYPEVK